MGPVRSRCQGPLGGSGQVRLDAIALPNPIFTHETTFPESATSSSEKLRKSKIIIRDRYIAPSESPSMSLECYQRYVEKRSYTTDVGVNFMTFGCQLNPSTTIRSRKPFVSMSRGP